MSLTRVYLARRRPCWVCSRSLMRLARGEHKGLFVGMRVERMGLERIVHVECADEFSRLVEAKESGRP